VLVEVLLSSGPGSEASAMLLLATATAAATTEDKDEEDQTNEDIGGTTFPGILEENGEGGRVWSPSFMPPLPPPLLLLAVLPLRSRRRGLSSMPRSR